MSREFNEGQLQNLLKEIRLPEATSGESLLAEFEDKSQREIDRRDCMVKHRKSVKALIRSPKFRVAQTQGA